MKPRILKKNKMLTNKFFLKINKYINVFWVFYCLVAIYPILNYSYEFNKPFYFTFKYVGLLATFIVLFTCIYKAKKQKAIVVVANFIEIAMVGSFVTLMSTGYILAINANIGTQKVTCIEGKVIDKWKDKQSGLVTTFNLKIETTTKQNKVLNVSKSAYQKLHTDSIYSNCWTKGVFGLLYK